MIPHVSEQLHFWDCTWESVPLCYSDDMCLGVRGCGHSCVCTHMSVWLYVPEWG